jgi:hypothetical protein
LSQCSRRGAWQEGASEAGEAHGTNSSELPPSPRQRPPNAPALDQVATLLLHQLKTNLLNLNVQELLTINIAAQNDKKCNKYHPPQRRRKPPLSGRDRALPWKIFSTRGIETKACRKGRRKRNACLNWWSGSAPTVKKR